MTDNPTEFDERRVRHRSSNQIVTYNILWPANDLLSSSKSARFLVVFELLIASLDSVLCRSTKALGMSKKKKTKKTSTSRYRLTLLILMA